LTERRCALFLTKRGEREIANVLLGKGEKERLKKTSRVLSPAGEKKVLRRSGARSLLRPIGRAEQKKEN